MLLVHWSQDRPPFTAVKQAKRYFIPARYALPRRLPRVTEPLRETDPKLWRLFPAALAASRMPFSAMVSRARAAPYFRFIAVLEGQPRSVSYRSRLILSMFMPSMRISWVGALRRGECRSPSL